LHLYPNMELQDINPGPDGHILKFMHPHTSNSMEFGSDAIILSTGYRNTSADFLSPLGGLVRYDDSGQFSVNRNYSIDRRNSLFVQNAESHTHGFNSSDLGLGPYRNAVILNTILGKEHFHVERKISFQHY
jgi:lysine N6-hydroxylase